MSSSPFSQCEQTLAAISESLLLLFHSRRGGCTKTVLEWGPLDTIFSHKPGFFVFQKRRQGLSERDQKERGRAEHKDDKGDFNLYPISFIKGTKVQKFNVVKNVSHLARFMSINLKKKKKYAIGSIIVVKMWIFNAKLL